MTRLAALYRPGLDFSDVALMTEQLREAIERANRELVEQWRKR